MAAYNDVVHHRAQRLPFVWTGHTVLMWPARLSLTANLLTLQACKQEMKKNKKWTFPRHRVHYVQYQYFFLFYILLTHPTHPPAYGPELNSSKTEFLLIGLSKQIAKINNSSLTTTHSARNLGFIFDEHLTFSDQISSSDLSPNLAIIIFVSFAVSVHTSIQKNSFHHRHFHCSLQA